MVVFESLFEIRILGIFVIFWICGMDVVWGCGCVFFVLKIFWGFGGSVFGLIGMLGVDVRCLWFVWLVWF